MPSQLQPHEVFTPSQLPLSRSNVYVHRQSVERDLRRYLTRGQVPLVFGEYGVGKTTVTRRVIQDLDLPGKTIYVGSTSGKKWADINQIVLEELDSWSLVEVTEGGSSSVKADLRFIAGQVGDEEKRTLRRDVAIPTSQKIVALMRDRKVTLIIDELHRADDSFRSDLADFIKASHGQESIWPYVVLVGTTSDGSQLVRTDPGIYRFVKELRVNTLSIDEANQLVIDGMSRLELRIEEELKDQLVSTAAGAPSLLQSMCLDMAESCLDDGRRELHAEDYRKAVKAYLKEHEHRLNESYIKWIEHSGPRRYRKQILIAMSKLDSEFPELEEIRVEVSRAVGADVPRTTLSGPLRDLKQGSDAVLVDVSRNDEDRVHNVSTFKDPMMKSFIRFVSEAERQGLLGDSQ